MTTITKYTRFLGIGTIILGIIAFIGLFFPLTIIEISDPGIILGDWFKITATPLGSIEIFRYPLALLLFSFLPPISDSSLLITLGYINLALILLIIIMGIIQIIKKDSPIPSLLAIILSGIIIIFLISQHISIREGFIHSYMHFGFFTAFNLSLFVISITENIIWYYSYDPSTATEFIGLSFYDITLDLGFYLILVTIIIVIALSIAIILLMKIKSSKEKETEPSKDLEKERRIETLEPATIKKIEQIVKVSDRIRLDMMQKTLGLTEEDFLNNIYNWAEEFNFKLDGDYLIINKEIIDSFLEFLKKKYS